MRKLSPSAIYLLTQFLFGLTNRTTNTTFAIYLVQSVGLDPLQMVLLGTIFEITIFVFEVPTGVVADVVSRRLSVLLGVLLTGIGSMVMGLEPVFGVVLLGHVIWGFGNTFISGAHTAWISDEIGVAAANRAFLRSRQFMLAGSLLGIPLAVALARGSLALPFLVGGGIRVVFVIFLALVMPETGFKRKPPEEREGWNDFFVTLRAGFDLVRGRRALTLFALISLFVGLYSEGWDRLGDPHLLQNFVFPPLFGLTLGAVEWFGVLSVAGMLLNLAANEVAVRRVNMSDSLTLARVLQALYAVMVACMLGFALARDFWLAILAMFVFDTLRGVSFPLSEAFINVYVDSRVRATVHSMAAQIDAFGELAGGPFIGAMGRWRGLRAAIIMGALVLAPVVPMYARLRRLPGEHSGPAPASS
ncbi:MAG: MFS transporter [Anaerolineae bacterium]|nr:MAG: MFS transporter [Anaerolineae bacterium]